MRVALLGLGLIGGSIARALRQDVGAWHVAAWTPSGHGPRRAFAAGVVDVAALTAREAIADAELVVLAGPPLACLAWIDELGGELHASLAEGAVVTDVASTKAAIVGRADAAGLRFVGGHPMAGRETSGFDASRADLLVDAPWVLVPGAHVQDEDRSRVERLAKACGARPVVMSSTAHDEAVAAISHLPLVLSAALVEAVAGAAAERAPAGWAAARALAAGGWEGMTRLARGDPAMGAGILATNGPAVAGHLRDVRSVIDDWIAALDGPATADATELADRLAAARRRLEEG